MNNRILRTIWPVVPIALAIASTTLLLIPFDASITGTFSAFWEGSFGSPESTFSTLAFWMPLLLCSVGLLMTFTAGLWNIGVEGQMIMGAIGATWVALKLTEALPGMPNWLFLPLEIIVAMAAGALWAALAAVLKTRGGVHEIFGGVALNNLAIIATNYLISGPWQPPEGGTFRGTDPFPSYALYPLLGNTRFSPLSAVLAIAALVLVALALRGTFWGLKLKALGKNMRSAFLLGISSEREAIIAMMLCGAMAGLAGSVRVASWFDSLRQSISGGIGFLAILIVLLAALRPILTLVISLVFSALLTGGTQVQLLTQLHSSLSGIIQGMLVLFALLFGDFEKVMALFRKDKNQIAAGVEGDA
jgi:simple sugar transport system permease protein